MREKPKDSVEQVWKLLATFIGLISGLASLILQIVAWSRDTQTLRYVSLAPFLVALATAAHFGRRAWEQKQGKRLTTILTLLFLVGWGYAFLWGIWLEPPAPGCADYALQITSPLDGSTVQADTIEVRGTLLASPSEGSLVIFVRSQDGISNWLQFDPIKTDPILKVWKGSASVLSGNSPQTYRIAIAFVGKSGHAMLEMYRKMGLETGHWPGVEFLPEDIQMCDEISITRQP